MDDALPNFSKKYGRIASNTSGRSGVVALLSRYTLRMDGPILASNWIREGPAGFGIGCYPQAVRFERLRSSMMDSPRKGCVHRYLLAIQLRPQRKPPGTSRVQTTLSPRNLEE